MRKEVKLHGASLEDSSMGDWLGINVAFAHILMLEATVGSASRLMPCAKCDCWELQGASSHSLWPCHFNRLFLDTEFFQLLILNKLQTSKKLPKTKHGAPQDLPLTLRVMSDWLVHYQNKKVRMDTIQLTRPHCPQIPSLSREAFTWALRCYVWGVRQPKAETLWELERQLNVRTLSDLAEEMGSIPGIYYGKLMTACNSSSGKLASMDTALICTNLYRDTQLKAKLTLKQKIFEKRLQLDKRRCGKRRGFGGGVLW